MLRVVDNPGRPQNELLSDPVTEMEPWMEFNRSELLQGRLPLLNPYNGGGVPHLANAQSAVLSPFSLPHYLLPKSPAYLLSAMLKLLAAAGFMLLFLRQLGLSSWAALLGAIGYAFCGHNLLLLSYPHVGAAALLPAMLYFTERVLGRHEAEGRMDRPGLGGLALSYGLCALSGQPEPLFFGALISAVYMAWRLSSRIRHAPDRGTEWLRIRPLLLGLGAAVVISMLISAVQLLPFIEYMQLSRLAEQREGTQTPLPRALWPLYAYPDLLGNPSLEYYLHSGVPPINYEAANSAYIGALMLFMAMVSLAVSGGKRTHTFFGAVMILWVLWAYDFWGINRWIAHLPLIGIAPINRSQFVFALAASICAAHLLDRLISLKSEQRVRFALGILLASIVSMAWFHAGTESLMERSVAFVKRLPNRTDFPLEQMPAAAWAHVREVQIAFAAGVLSLAVVALASRTWLRTAGCIAVAAVCFLQTGWLHRGYNPLIAIEQHMPRTPLIEKLASSVGNGNLAIVGTEALPPSMNMPYGIRLLANYDGMWVGGYDRLYRSRFGTEANWRTMNRADTSSFELFGAEYLLTLPGWQPIDTLFPGVPWNPRAFMNIEPVKPGNDLIQTFTVPTGSLSGVRFWVDMRGSKPDGIWAVRVRDAGSFEMIYEHQLDSQQLVPGPDGFAEVVLEFPPLHQSQGRLLRLRMECQELRSGDGMRPVVREDMPDWQNQMLHDQSRRWNRESRKKAPPSLAGEGNAHPELSKWKLFRGTAESGGGLAMDLRVGDGLPPAIDTIGPYALRKLPTSQRYRIVGQAITVSGPDAARLELDHPGFVPNSMVVLESDDTPGVVGTAIAAGVCEILEEDSTTASLRVKVDSPGWLVTSKPYLPGWKVQVNGKDVPTLLANEGFLAVQVPVGVHRIDIRYSPASAMTGTWMTVLGVMLLVLLWRTRATPAS